jgi:hypothetical protein
MFRLRCTYRLKLTVFNKSAPANPQLSGRNESSLLIPFIAFLDIVDDYNMQIYPCQYMNNEKILAA